MLLNLFLKKTKQATCNASTTATKLKNTVKNIHQYFSSSSSSSSPVASTSSSTLFHNSKREYSSFRLLGNTQKKFQFVVISKRNLSTTRVNMKLVQRFDNIIKSSQDKRLYRGLLLDNELKCLIVSDPSTDRSAASVDVHAGYMLDPKEFPGLAHFCEHMLFMGSKKVN